MSLAHFQPHHRPAATGSRRANGKVRRFWYRRSPTIEAPCKIRTAHRDRSGPAAETVSLSARTLHHSHHSAPGFGRGALGAGPPRWYAYRPRQRHGLRHEPPRSGAEPGRIIYRIRRCDHEYETSQALPTRHRVAGHRPLSRRGPAERPPVLEQILEGGALAPLRHCCPDGLYDHPSTQPSRWGFIVDRAPTPPQTEGTDPLQGRTFKRSPPLSSYSTICIFTDSGRIRIAYSNASTLLSKPYRSVSSGLRSILPLPIRSIARG